MKRLKLIAFVGLLAFTACAPKQNKKVMILSKGDITAEGANVTIKGSSGSADKTIDLADEKTLEVSTPDGKKSVNVPAEDGFYILNLRTDTIVGAEQNLKNDLGGGTITQEMLKGKIDSLGKLTAGANVSAQNHNYLIAPGEIKKISASKSAKVFGPFTKVSSSIEADENGKAPEIYKFYTNGEVRELIEKFKKMTI
jgi:hypothetical protein